MHISNWAAHIGVIWAHQRWKICSEHATVNSQTVIHVTYWRLFIIYV